MGRRAIIVRGAGEDAQVVRRSKADEKYFNANYERLCEQYPNEWFAVYKRNVIGHDKDYVQLTEQLRRDGIDTGNVYFRRTYSCL